MFDAILPDVFMHCLLTIFHQLQNSSEFQDVHKTAVTLLPMLVATLESEEQNKLLETVLRRSSADLLQISLCECFGDLVCALFRCLESSLDITNFPPTFQSSKCPLCDKRDKSKNIMGKFK